VHRYVPIAVLVLVSLLAGGLGTLAVERVIHDRATRAVAGRRLRSVALATIAAGCLVLAALALLQRQNDVVLRLDHTVAAWAHDHATHRSTRLITLVTDLGSTPIVPLLGVLLVLAEWRRLPDRYLAPFLLVTVLGCQLLTVTIKAGVDRARPTLNPLAASLGPSFPSGHSSTAASFYAAAALILARGRGVRASSLIAGAAVALIAAVATSRVFLDVHWVSDVIAGVALGWAWCALCALACRGRLFSFRTPSESRPAPRE
jgi:membrane-associated phospholipid phosphatase